MKDSFGIHARYMYPQWQSRYNRDTFRIHARYMIIHAGYMRDTCGKRVSGGWGNVWMPSWRAAHPSGHPCQPCAEVGLLQHPPALLSSALSWPPLSQEYKDRMYKDRSTRSTRKAQAVGLEIRILECIPYVSDMYRECILCAMYLRVKIHCILNVS